MAFTMQAVNNFRAVPVQELALQMQDEAYTFAYYLLGDEGAAEAATQAAFRSVPRRGTLRVEQFRQDVLRGVLIGSRKFTALIPATAPAAREDITRMLMHLPAAERCALVLVDVLGLDYDFAAAVMGCSIKQIGKLLAQGRVKVLPVGRVQ